MSARKPWIYIAAPYTTPDPVDNTRGAIQVADAFLEWGVAVPIVPHLTMFWHFVSPRPYEEWLAYDRELLERCDALVRLAGESPGADAEVTFARSLGLAVFDGQLPVPDALRWAAEYVREVPA